MPQVPWDKIPDVEPKSGNYDDLINSSSKKHGVDPNLIRAMIHQESGGKSDALSPKGAQGIMQLMPETAKGLGVTDPNDPAQNIDAGVRLMKQHLDKYKGDIDKSLAAYHAGEGAVDKANGIPDTNDGLISTSDYVKSIKSRYTPSKKTPVFDWTKVPNAEAEEGETTIGPNKGGVTNWLGELQNDIMSGSDNTFVGKALKKLGAPGLTKGEPESVSRFVGGPLIGPVDAAHGAATVIDPETDIDSKVHGANEIFHGLGETAALPAGALAPGSFLPSLAVGGAAQQGTQKLVESAGVDPETAELASNLITVGLPFAKKAMPSTGRLISRTSGPASRIAGPLIGVTKAIKTQNPYWLAAGIPHITKAAGSALDIFGKGITATGETPLLPHEVIGSGAPKATVSAEQKMLPKPPLVTPPPSGGEEGPIARPAASVVTRGKGGRMTKQFLTSDSADKAKPVELIKSIEPEPKAPPQVEEKFRTEETGRSSDQVPAIKKSVSIPTAEEADAQFAEEQRNAENNPLREGGVVPGSVRMARGESISLAQPDEFTPELKEALTDKRLVEVQGGHGDRSMTNIIPQFKSLKDINLSKVNPEERDEVFDVARQADAMNRGKLIQRVEIPGMLTQEERDLADQAHGLDSTVDDLERQRAQSKTFGDFVRHGNLKGQFETIQGDQKTPLGNIISKFGSLKDVDLNSLNPVEKEMVIDALRFSDESGKKPLIDVQKIVPQESSDTSKAIDFLRGQQVDVTGMSDEQIFNKAKELGWTGAPSRVIGPNRGKLIDFPHKPEPPEPPKKPPKGAA